MDIKSVGMSVSLISEPTKNAIAMAGKLCYAKDIDNISMTEHEENVFVKMLEEIGHESPFEHAAFTFLIRGVSRTLTHQLVRHRIASYSQRSQRYVAEFDFKYVAPLEISFDMAADSVMKFAMEQAHRNYMTISALLTLKFIAEKNLPESTTEEHEAKIEIYRKYDHFSAMCSDLQNPIPTETITQISEETKRLARILMTNQEYSAIEKKAIENARAVLPNATASDIIVTMNARTLNHFFGDRMCKRAQEEIREMAGKMRQTLLDNGHEFFRSSGPKCFHLGYCPEGSSSCGMRPTKRDMLATYYEATAESKVTSKENSDSEE